MINRQESSIKYETIVKQYLTTITLTLIGLLVLATGQVQAQDSEGNVIIIKMVDNSTNEWRFEPEVVMVQPGDTIRWVQEDVAPHNVEFKSWSEGIELGSLQMGPFLLQKGDVFDLVIDDRFKEGEYSYVCTPHAPMGMKASFMVMANHDHGNH